MHVVILRDSDESLYILAYFFNIRKSRFFFDVLLVDVNKKKEVHIVWTEWGRLVDKQTGEISRAHRISRFNIFCSTPHHLECFKFS